MFKIVRKMLGRDDRNRELPDPVPLAPPVGWFKQPSMFDHVRDMVRGEHMRLYAESQGAETFEEASDFDVEDDLFPASQFEDADDFEPLENLQERRQAEFRREWLRKREERLRKQDEAEDAREAAEKAAQAAGLGRSSSSGAPGARPGRAPEGDQGGAGGPPPA